MTHGGPRWRTDAETVALVLFGAAVLGVGIGSATGITGLDEYWHSIRTAMQSLQDQAWLVPTLDGEARIEKPPLYYWLMMLSMQIFGIDFFGARLPSLIFGLAFALSVCSLARRLFGDDGILAFLLAISLLTIAVESRRAMLDLPVAACVSMALLSAIVAMQATRSSRFWVLTVFAALAGFMIKGPVALWFLVAAGMAALLRPVPGFNPPKPTVLLLVSLSVVALGAIWPLGVWLSVPDALARIAEDSSDRQFGWPSIRNIGAIVGGIIAVGLPWIGAAASMARDDRLTATNRRIVEWLIVWMVISLVPFFFMRTFERYLLPLAVPIALLATHSLRSVARGLRWKLLSASVFAAIPVVFFVAVFFWFPSPAVSEADTSITAAAAGAAVLSVAIAIFAALGRNAMVVAASLAVGVALTLGIVYPAIGVNRIPSTVVESLNQRTVAHFSSPYPGTLSMQLGRSIPFTDGGDVNALAAWAQRDTVFILREEDFSQLVEVTRAAGFIPVREASFTMLYSRGSFAKIVRPGVTTEEWKAAIGERSLARITPRFLLVRLSR